MGFEVESHIVRVWCVQSDALKLVVHCGKRMLYSRVFGDCVVGALRDVQVVEPAEIVARTNGLTDRWRRAAR